MNTEKQKMIEHDYVWSIPGSDIQTKLSTNQVDTYNRYTSDINAISGHATRNFIQDQRHKYLVSCFDEVKSKIALLDEPMKPRLTRPVTANVYGEGRLECISKQANEFTLSDLVSEQKHYKAHRDSVFDNPTSTKAQRNRAQDLAESFFLFIDYLPVKQCDSFHAWENTIARVQSGLKKEVETVLFHHQTPLQQQATLAARSSVQAPDAPIDQTRMNVLSAPNSDVAKFLYGEEKVTKLTDFLTVASNNVTQRYLGHIDGEIVSSIVVEKQSKHNPLNMVKMAYTAPEHQSKELSMRMLRVVAKDFKGNLDIGHSFELMGVKIDKPNKEVMAR